MVNIKTAISTVNQGLFIAVSGARVQRRPKDVAHPAHAGLR
jgi:DNA-binding cell septation regulator SpoVG